MTGRHRFAALLVVVLSSAAGRVSAQPAEARGQVLMAAHQAAVAEAIRSLPKQIKKFYENHRQEMPSQALEPAFPARGHDRRFLVDRLLPFPFAGLPRSESALVSKFGDEAEAVGRLPWLLQDSYDRLVDAFRAGDVVRILEGSDETAGLVVDVHSPLNLTKNFDGQETGQHGLWLRVLDRLPTAMGKGLKLQADAANYLDDPDEYVFSMMLESYVWADNVFYLEELASRGKSGHGAPYYDALARRVGPILRTRLSRAAEDAGSYWYTAWTVAGRPDVK